MKSFAIALVLVFSVDRAIASAPVAARVHELPGEPKACFLMESLDGADVYVSNQAECRVASAPGDYRMARVDGVGPQDDRAWCAWREPR